MVHRARPEIASHDASGRVGAGQGIRRIVSPGITAQRGHAVMTKLARPTSLIERRISPGEDHEGLNGDRLGVRFSQRLGQREAEMVAVREFDGAQRPELGLLEVDLSPSERGPVICECRLAVPGHIDDGRPVGMEMVLMNSNRRTIAGDIVHS